MSEQHADLLQFQLREECLKLGAALFYCSGTDKTAPRQPIVTAKSASIELRVPPPAIFGIAIYGS